MSQNQHFSDINAMVGILIASLKDELQEFGVGKSRKEIIDNLGKLSKLIQ